MNRKMKHLRLLFLFLFLSSNVIFAQQVNYSQALSDLISTKKWFEIEDYYQQHKDSIDKEFVELWYIAETGNVFNRPLESINAYEQLIDKNPLNMDMPTLIGLFWQPLLQLCADVQEYAKAQELCGKIITLLENDTVVDSEMRSSYIQGFTQAIESFMQFEKTYPKLSITKKDDKPKEIKLIKNDSSSGIFFNAKWNGNKLKTFFDTGAGTSYIYNRTIAEKIGVKLNESDTIITNEGTIRGFMGVVDSLELGDFCIKNVSVFVNIETIDPTDSIQVKCDSIMNSMYDIVLGIPVIKQLGIIEFDFGNNSMSFRQKTPLTKKKNLYIDKTLYLNMKICNANFLNFFDTGGEMGLTINTGFYKENKDCIPIKEQTSKSGVFVGSCNQPSFSHRNEYDCPQIDININDQIITMINDCSVAKGQEDNNKFGTEEGSFFGNAIFKYCKKATFDFVNMAFSVEK
jgi:tetratricopeptide (TPR) repeat protein